MEHWTTQPREPKGSEKGGQWKSDKFEAAERIYDSSFASGVRDKKAIEQKSIEETPSIEKLLGVEYKGYKGQEAVEKLLLEKQGHIKNAFYREDIGSIDLLWGNDNLGLQHIINHREKQGIDATLFLSDIAEVVEKGEYKGKNKNNTFEFWYKGKMAIISPEYHGNKITFLLSAFKRQKNKGSQSAIL